MLYLWAVSGAATAVFLEVLYRQQGWLWWTAPLQVFIGYAVARLLIGSPTFIAAVALFSFAVLFARIGVSLVLFKEGAHASTWAVAVLLLAAAIVGRVWK